MIKKQRIVTIGGGSGSFMVLTGLKKYSADLSAIVNMTDDGGSSGMLRDELGVLPAGDIRQCLLALSQADEALKELFNYRYASGSLSGHNFGNIFLATLEKVTGDINMSIKTAGHILDINGQVLPVTLKSAKLTAILKNGRKIIGESKIYHAPDLSNIKDFYLEPAASLNPAVAAAIGRADKIIINPGDLYASLIPIFLVKGLGRAIAKASAKVIYVSNSTTKPGQTYGFTLVDYIKTLEKYLGREVIGYAIYNKEKPDQRYIKNLVQTGDLGQLPKIEFLGYNLLNHDVYKTKPGDALGHLRSMIKYDPNKLAKIIYNI